jgi:GATA zinc finger domain-containing protein 1
LQQGSYWQVGDIVSVLDEDDQQLYYAQLRGFLQDQYCNKSAVITWLVPVTGAKITNPSEFNPAAYVAGQERGIYLYKLDASTCLL